MRKPTLFYARPDDARPMMDINTTPLIDVMLVLLIALIVTMPLMTHAVKVDMPNGPTGEVKRERVAIYIDFDGSLYWNDSAISGVEELEGFFRSSELQRTQPDVIVTANRHAKYDTVALVLAATQRSGMKRVGFAGLNALDE
jgi:biopolymer transport protein ExbD